MIWEHSINPVILQIWGPLALRWYPVAYILGFAVGYLGLRILSGKGIIPFDRKTVDDLIFDAALGVIIGGRLGYVLFYGLSDFLASPLFLFKVNEGGMSFHGGLLGVMVAAFLFSKRKHYDFWTVLGSLAFLAPAGLFFGRIANFINGELWGKPTDGSWGVIFPLAGITPRHPTQLYEAFLEGILLFLILLFVLKKTRNIRLSGPLFGAVYGVFRFFVEFYREPDAHIGYLLWGWVTMGQILSLFVILLSVAMYYIFIKDKEKRYAEH
ncbi:MAG TPA: prolipoprotein diacylglyceryl transferase [Firmicutes bacterium]|nr:prolipoprotein diacylglyceryl transferase [Bacillota bacterium]